MATLPYRKAPELEGRPASRYRVVIVGADFFQTQPGPLLEPLPPCRDLVTR